MNKQLNLFRSIDVFLEDFLEIYGLGRKTILTLYTNKGINISYYNKNTTPLKKFLLKDKIKIFLKSFIKTSPNTGDRLKHELYETQQFLWKIRCYKGIRHKLKLPARGQRTHTNAQTKRAIGFTLK